MPYALLISESQKLINEYTAIVSARHTPVEKKETPEAVKLSARAAAMLACAEVTGEIIISKGFGGSTYQAGVHNMNASNTPRELASWDAAVDELIKGDMIRSSYCKKGDSIYQITELGYKYFDCNLKDLDRDLTPSDLIVVLSESRQQLTEKEKQIFETLVELDSEPTLKEIALYTDLNENNLRRVLSALNEKGYVEIRKVGRCRYYSAIKNGAGRFF